MWEILLGLMGLPLHEGSIVDANSSLSQRLTLGLISEGGDPDSASTEWACRALGPKPNPSLRFQASIITLLAHKPPRVAILGAQRSTLPAHQKKSIAYGVAQKRQMRIHLLGPRQHPHCTGYPKH